MSAPPAFEVDPVREAVKHYTGVVLPDTGSIQIRVIQ